LIGLDNSMEFLKISLNYLRSTSDLTEDEKNNIQIILGDLSYLPFRTNSIQNIFSIATIHHIKGKQQRKKVLSQLFNILSNNGALILTVWKRWQKKFRKFFIYDWFKRILIPKFRNLQRKKGLPDFGDKYIPWTNSHDNYIYQRFYHFFSKNEVMDLLEAFNIKEIEELGGPNKKDNFFVLAQK